MRRALEAQNPDVAFDWKTIVETPIPSADTERWRERRRVEKALRHAAAEDEAAETALDSKPREDPAEEPVAVIEASAAEIAPVAVHQLRPRLRGRRRCRADANGAGVTDAAAAIRAARLSRAKRGAGDGSRPGGPPASEPVED